MVTLLSINKLTSHVQWLPIHLVHPCQPHLAKLVKLFQIDPLGPALIGTDCLLFDHHCQVIINLLMEVMYLQRNQLLTTLVSTKIIIIIVLSHVSHVIVTHT